MAVRAVLALSLVAVAAARKLSYYPDAFSAAEVDALVALFDQTPDYRDVREDDRVARTGRWLARDAIRNGTLDWVAARILETHGAWPGETPRTFLADRVEFVLRHDFGVEDYFGWHVDVEPDDPEGTRRSLNVNVLLSDAETDFDGGALEVGDANATLTRGGLYVYPAALPHRVLPVTRGRRLTLVVATLRSAGDDGGGYWRAAKAEIERLCVELLPAACLRVADARKASLVATLGKRARTLGRVGEVAAAGRALEAAAMLHPGDPAIPANQAGLLLGAGDLDAAAAKIARAARVAEGGNAPAAIVDQVKALAARIAAARGAPAAGEL